MTYYLYRNYDTENRELIGEYKTKEDVETAEAREKRRTSSGLRQDNSPLKITTIKWKRGGFEVVLVETGFSCRGYSCSSYNEIFKKTFDTKLEAYEKAVSLVDKFNKLIDEGYYVGLYLLDFEEDEYLLEFDQSDKIEVINGDTIVVNKTTKEVATI